MVLDLNGTVKGMVGLNGTVEGMVGLGVELVLSSGLELWLKDIPGFCQKSWMKVCL